MIIGSVHSSIDDTPNTSMFARAGGGSVQRKKADCVAESLADFVKLLSCALTPPSHPSNGSRITSGTSPAKSIDSRSKCYKQLNNLKITVLSDEEMEKDAIMTTLKKL